MEKVPVAIARADAMKLGPDICEYTPEMKLVDLTEYRLTGEYVGKYFSARCATLYGKTGEGDNERILCCDRPKGHSGQHFCCSFIASATGDPEFDFQYVCDMKFCNGRKRKFCKELSKEAREKHEREGPF